MTLFVSLDAFTIGCKLISHIVQVFLFVILKNFKK